MSEVAALALVLAVTAFAAFVQAATGFGFGVIAVPLYLLAIDGPGAVQLTIIASAPIGLILIPRLLGAVDKRVLLAFCGGAALGWPLGFGLFLAIDPEPLKLWIGLAVLAAAGAAALQRLAPARPGAGVTLPSWELASVGVAAGLMTTFLAMPGPPALLYFLIKRAEPKTTRAALTINLGLSILAALAIHGATGRIGADIWGWALWAVPIAALFTLLGDRAAPFVSKRLFEAVCIALLTVSGAMALWAGL